LNWEDFERASELARRLVSRAEAAAYRRDGWGRPAYDPAMMVALLLYVYARAERSSRGIERRGKDVAYRAITANQVPDRALSARS
jgi:transposase